MTNGTSTTPTSAISTALEPTGHPHPLLTDTEAREHTAHTESPLTPEQATLVLDDGLGAWVTEPTETELRDLDSDPDPDLAANVPWLAARVILNDYRPQAYGRQTKVWLDYGTTTAELLPAQAREALEAMRAFLPRLEAVVELAEQTAAGDFEGDPEIARLDREAEKRRIRAIDDARLKAILEGLQ
ncbi:hypothetical protein [Streptomyces sp. S1D4-20]|uniref:hypothetical protein n=1 Tax=Streptomyces sp. S1D4-20 TaxID=2594462 RepID=UPI0011638A7D|nr:hypothetical protein [Streptomyces sp. S1D4-20]QDN58714.1 hypothetical protein FNV67_28405 [Streptomyces sp. S1D4-20]